MLLGNDLGAFGASSGGRLALTAPMGPPIAAPKTTATVARPQHRRDDHRSESAPCPKTPPPQTTQTRPGSGASSIPPHHKPRPE
jgi:hypothetical protein